MRDLGYQKCSDTLAKIELAGDNKVKDSYNNRIADRESSSSSISALDKGECRGRAYYLRREHFYPSAWQSDDCHAVIINTIAVT